ncbi:MAG: 2,3-bisphosphoglycerate-independent phosphoglycerate mutase [Thermoplasmata archaeon]
MNEKKMLMIVCDGLSDRPAKDFDRKTPLQAARKPAMDAVARHGMNGVMDVIAPGVVPGSDTAHLALFGYDPYKAYSGRGPIEAAGAGLDVRKGDVAFRCNFATVDGSMSVTDRRAGRIKSGTAQLAAALSGLKIDDVQVLFKAGSEHRGVLLLRGPGLDSRVTDADPHHEGKVLESKGLVPEAEKTARVVNEFVRLSHQVLDEAPVNRERRAQGLPPANIVLPRGAGSLGELEPMPHLYGFKCAAVAGVTLVRGICRMVGMDVLDVPGATGGLDTDYKAKGDAAMRALDSHDFVFMNVKACDIAGHDGDFRLKVQVIESIDSMLAGMLRDLHEDVVVVLTADHSTPVSVRDHSADPVPVAISGGGARIDHVKEYDEMSAASGALGRIRGKDLMPTVMGVADRAKKFGA